MDARSAILCGMLTCFAAQSAAAQLATRSSPALSIPATAHEMPVDCKAAVYRFLPGEFNFCLATRYSQQRRYRSEREMLKLSAAWGKKPAQYALGITYFNGEHVPADRPLGLAWLALAAERRDNKYQAKLNSAYGHATPAERERAVTLLRQMKPKYGDAFAARRAQRHFDREIHGLDWGEVYGAHLCIAGITGGVINEANPADSVCPPIGAVVHTLQAMGDRYFEGWQGHVTVGPLQPTPADGN